MKKKLLFAFVALLAALSLPAAAQESLEMPDVQPVEGGITIVVHIPEGTDCNGAPIWGGEDNDWSGKLMEAVEGADGWYKTDIDATSTQGKMLANFEGWENGLGNWPTQWKEMEILESTTSTSYGFTPDGNILIDIDSEGIIYISVKSWLQNPCIPDREFKFTIVVPDCTPEGQETVNIVGSFDEDPEEEGVQSWYNGMDFPIVDGKAEITITGQETTEWKVRLTNDYDWSQQAVHWGYYEYEDRFTAIADDNRTLGEAEGKEIYIQGWGDFGAPLGDCFADMPTVTDMTLSETGLTFVLNNLPTEPVSITATAVIDGSITDITELCEWSSSNETVATVENGKVSIVGTGLAVITCDYNGLERTLSVNVGKASFDFSTLLQGDEYYIFQMDDETFAELDAAGKVVSDMRSDGEFDDYGNIVPEDANRIYYPWNPSEEIADAPQSGQSAFGKLEEWFSIASADPTPQGGWGNICGGLGIGTWEYPASSDAEVAKLQDLTPEHEFVVVLKGNYTSTKYLTIQLSDATGLPHDALVVDRYTGDCLDGGWEAFSFTYQELLAMGIDLSQPINATTWYPFAFIAQGAGNRVDIDAVFFYIPEETEVSAIEENETDADNTDIKVTAANGRIYCEYPFTVINLAGQDVTALNGSLQGTYIVLAEGQAVKVSVD